VVMAALRRPCLRRLVARHRLLRLFRAVVTVFRRLRLHRRVALCRHLWRPLCVWVTAPRRHLIVPLQPCPSLRMRYMYYICGLWPPDNVSCL
jgi:hypothetical protein